MSVNRKCGAIAGAALLCFACLSSGAYAEDLIVESIAVKYAPAELTTPQGAKKLYARIQRAASVVCHKPDVRDISVHSDYWTCYNNAVDSAVSKVDATELTALHRNRTQRSAAG